MPGKKSAIVGFLIGVILTLILAGGAGYLLYQKIERAISPETTRATAEEQLSKLARQPVTVGEAKADLIESLLTLNKVRIGSGTETFLEIEKVELAAEGGVQGLRAGRFSEAVLTHPVVSLEKREGRWNLQTYLAPIIEGARKAAGLPREITSEPSSVADGPQISLRSIRVSDLEIQLALDDGASFTGLSVSEVDLAREGPGTPWNLTARGTQVQVNTTSGDMPLLGALQEAQTLLGGASGSKALGGSKAVSPALAGVALEDVSLEWSQPSQILSFEGLSFRAEDFFRLLSMQTGSLEKKNSPSEV